MSKYKYDKSSGYVRKSVRNGWNALSGIPLLRELRKLERRDEYQKDQNAKLRQVIDDLVIWHNCASGVDEWLKSLEDAESAAQELEAKGADQ